MGQNFVAVPQVADLSKKNLSAVNFSYYFVMDINHRYKILVIFQLYGMEATIEVP